MTSAELAGRLPEALPDNPMHWLEAWLEHATVNEVQPNPNAMTLSTIGADGSPTSRVVLCKALSADPGYAVFYTNYHSQKGADIERSDAVSLLFHWDALGRQARVEGRAVRSPGEESDRYFASRDRGSQIGAWGSDQSRPIASRSALLQQLAERARSIGAADDDEAPVRRPPHWGGYRVWASAVELWIEGSDRVHDRARWVRELRADEQGGFVAGPWTGTRLQP